MIYRVLLVEDYEPWRRLVSSRLQKSLQWQVVGEAPNGLDAVHKAETLRPDLILLDVGLPMLSGIEAARQILAHDQDIRVLFLSENSSSDIVEAALETGARGYVLKSDASRELLPAMEAVIEGRQYVSTSLTEHIEPSSRVAPKCALHEVAFYSDNVSLLQDYGKFAEAALNSGKALIVVSGDILRRALERELVDRGMDVTRLAREGRYRWVDVSVALSSVLVENLPDEKRFWEAMPPAIKEAARASTSDPPRVAAWGECAPTLLRAGNVEGAIRLEQLWDELGRTYDLDIFCAYPKKDLSDGEDNSIYERICAIHSVVHS